MTTSGVLLINLGTPDAPTPEAVRRFLREFLSDRRVIDLPRLLWWPILYGVILPLRPRRIAPSYRKIWMAEGSPLLVHSQRLLEGVQARLRGTAGDIAVALGMRYGWPTVAAALRELELRKPDRLLIVPLFPQYSRTTTAAALDAVQAAMQGRAWRPELRIVNDYHDDAGYITALKDSVLAHWQAHGRAGHLLMSFHGIPARYVKAGDPYPAQCERTATRLAQALALPPGAWTLSYQSRVGRAPWTAPYTDEVLARLAREGTTAVDVICPGFAADCLETLEEIAIRYAELFRGAGGQALRYIPALNDRPAHVNWLADRIASALA